MDTMVLLVGDSRRDEDDDYACSHNLAGVPKQVQVERLRLHVGGDALKTVSISFQSHLIACMGGESVGGSTQCFPRI